MIPENKIEPKMKTNAQKRGSWNGVEKKSFHLNRQPVKENVN